MSGIPYLELIRYEVSSELILTPIQNENACNLIAKRLVVMDPWRTLGFEYDALVRYMLHTDSSLYCYGIIYQSQFSGVICIRHPWLRGPYIELLGVFAQFQKQGIGGNVINWLSQHTQGYSRNLWVMVSSFNKTARHFYQAHGFSSIATIPHLVKENHDEILMRKLL